MSLRRDNGNRKIIGPVCTGQPKAYYIIYVIEATASILTCTVSNVIVETRAVGHFIQVKCAAYTTIIVTPEAYLALCTWPVKVK